MKNHTLITFEVRDRVAWISLNRPEKRNAINREMFMEINDVFSRVRDTAEIRAAVISGEGKSFCSGIDVSFLAGIPSQVPDEPGRAAEFLRLLILEAQECFNSIENCRKPVIAAIHGHCLGLAIDLVSACDMRYCTLESEFSIREVDMGMAADVGTLQRLPHIISDGIMRELAYTARKFNGGEAREIGLVNRCFSSMEELFETVSEIAGLIAEKSPLAVRGTKEMILYARDHDIRDGLNYIATWNAGMLQSEDMKIAITASLKKETAEFKD